MDLLQKLIASQQLTKLLFFLGIVWLLLAILHTVLGKKYTVVVYALLLSIFLAFTIYTKLIDKTGK